MEWGATLWTAFALVLIIEGLMPFLSPPAWRRMFLQMVALRDGQIRFCALLSIALGVVLLAVL